MQSTLGSADQIFGAFSVSGAATRLCSPAVAAGAVGTVFSVFAIVFFSVESPLWLRLKLVGSNGNFALV